MVLGYCTRCQGWCPCCCSFVSSNDPRIAEDFLIGLPQESVRKTRPEPTSPGPGQPLMCLPQSRLHKVSVITKAGVTQLSFLLGAGISTLYDMSGGVEKYVKRHF